METMKTQFEVSVHWNECANACQGEEGVSSQAVTVPLEDLERCPMDKCNVLCESFRSGCADKLEVLKSDVVAGGEYCVEGSEVESCNAVDESSYEGGRDGKVLEGSGNDTEEESRCSTDEDREMTMRSNCVGRRKAVVKRPIQKCPIPDCNRQSKRPSRHLQQFHKMSPKSSSLIVNLLKAYNRNREHRPTMPSGRKSDCYKQCSVCQKFVTRLDKHHDRFHNTSTAAPPTAISWGTGSPTTTNVAMKMDCDERDDKEMVSEGNTSSDEDEEIDEEDSDYTEDLEELQVDDAVTAMLSEFKKWLGAPCGGKMSERSIELYVHGCCRAIASLGGCVEDIKNYEQIGRPGGLMEQMENANRKATTIRVALYGMQKFVEFLQATKRELFSAEESRAAVVTLKNYGSSLKRDVCLQRQQKRRASQNEVEAALPRMSVYTKTHHYQRAKEILSSGAPLTYREFMHLKEYIIAQLILNNGPRTGVILNCLLSEYHDAKEVDGQHVINVTSHKTACNGEARIGVNADLWEELKMYVSLRSKTIDDQKYLFPTRNGCMMQSNHVSRCLNRALDLKTNTTTMRKATVVLHMETDATDKDMSNLATLMCHKSSTQKSYYDVRCKDKVASMASRDISARLESYKVSADQYLLCVCVCQPHDGTE